MTPLRKFLVWLLSSRLFVGHAEEPFNKYENDKAPPEPRHLHVESWGPEEIVFSAPARRGRPQRWQKLSTHGTAVTLVQCENHNSDLLRSEKVTSAPDFYVGIRELFPSAFERRKGRNKPGSRIRLEFNNVGSGVRLLVRVKVPLQAEVPGVKIPLALPESMLRLVRDAEPHPTILPNGLAVLPVQNRTTSVVFEVIGSDPRYTHQTRIGVYVSFISNTALDLPELGQTTVTVALAPPNPAGDTGMPRHAVLVRRCMLDLLFPFVTGRDGFDTRIVIANTSADPFGTTPQHGPVKVNFYGDTGMTSTEEANDKWSPPLATFTSQVIPAGRTLQYSLSTGGDGLPATPNFRGYLVVTTEFQYSHGMAFISREDGRESYVYPGIHLGRGYPPVKL